MKKSREQSTGECCEAEDERAVSEGHFQIQRLENMKTGQGKMNSKAPTRFSEWQPARLTVMKVCVDFWKPVLVFNL